MYEIKLDRLSEIEASGIWHSIGAVSLYSGDSSILRQVRSRENASFFRDALFAHTDRDEIEIIGDFLAFEKIFVDKKALERSSINIEKLKTALGPLSDQFQLVDIPSEFYIDIMRNIENIKTEKHQGLKYLEKLYSEYAGGPYFWDHSLKNLADGLDRENLPQNPPGSFIDSSGSVERVLFYAELQRQSGQPVRLSTAHINVFSQFRDYLPISIIESLSAENAQSKIEKIVSDHEPELFKIPTPPLIDIIFDHIGEQNTETTISQAIKDIRRDWDAVSYRKFVRDVSVCTIKRDFPGLRKLESDLALQLQRVNEQGNAQSRFTGRVDGSLNFLGVRVNTPVPVLRHQDRDYVGFIGRWLGP